MALTTVRSSDLAAVRTRLDLSVVALGRMVADGLFGTQADTCGFELELDLVSPLGRPRLVNDPVLAAMDRRDFQAELSRFNLELNLAARPIHGALLRHLDAEIAGTMASATAVAGGWGAHVVAIGTLPTLHAEDLTAVNLSANPRYRLLDAQMASARNQPIHIDLRGRERLQLETDSIGLQAAATSLQVHLRVTPADFARYYNAAQAISPAQIAVGANSPWLLGRSIWQETRIPLLQQSLDITPGQDRRARPPRVWSGDRWCTGIVELFADNVARYDPLLPMIEDEDPLEELAAGRVPALQELRIHNGSIWRWNRPVYDVQHGHPHLRVENRVLPSGPTAVDMAANCALFLGLVRAVADQESPVSDRLAFTDVADDLQRAARWGLEAELHHLAMNRRGVGVAQRVLLDSLLPLAAEGLEAWGVDSADSSRYLGVLADRAACKRTGADWQTCMVEALEAGGRSREGALREMVRRYAENATTGQPVHTWSV